MTLEIWYDMAILNSHRLYHIKWWLQWVQHQTVAPQAQLLCCRGAILEFLRCELEEQETCARNAWIHGKKTEMSWSCNPKIQGMKHKGFFIGGCLIVLRNSVEKSALTTTMGLNKSMALKDHVAENRLVWIRSFALQKLQYGLWNFTHLGSFWPCRIRQVISSQDQEMRNGEFLLRGMSPSMKAWFVPPEFENNAGMALQ